MWEKNLTSDFFDKIPFIQENKIKKYAILVFVSAAFLFAFRSLECVDERKTTNYLEKCTNTICDSYFNGHCMDSIAITPHIQTNILSV